ncbi:MAG: hypothetical protein ACI97K_001962 [Glaciecola sp.]|jgi:hypothetical protein
MDILLVSAGIKAMLRAAQTGIDLSVERKIDSAIFLPTIRLPQSTPLQQVNDFLNEAENIPLRSQAPFAMGWYQPSLSWTYTDADNSQACIAKMLELQSADSLIDSPTEQKNMLIGGRMIEQWRNDNQPPTAWSRMALTLVDIGVEFIAAYPSVMGVDSKGEKLVVAFADELGSLIPNDIEDMGKRHDFENRVLSLFVRSSLSVLAENTKVIIDDEQVAAIVSGVIKPIVVQMENSDIGEVIQYRELITSLIGPSSEAIMRLVANKAEDYIGDNFLDDKALSAVTKAFLNAATETVQSKNIAAVFSKQGLSALLVAGLDVAIKQPEVFFDETKNIDNTAAMQALLSNVASSLSAGVNDTLDKKLSTALAINVINAVGENASILFKLDASKPWDKLAASLIQDFSAELSTSLVDGSRIDLFNSEQKQRLTNLILTQISQSPSMLSIHDQTALKVLKGTIAIIQRDNNFMLSNEDWLAFTELLSNAAINDFERLFNKTMSLAGEQEALLTAMLVPLVQRIEQFNSDSAALAWQADTVMHLFTNTVEGLKGNISGLLNKPNIINELLDDLLLKTANDPDQWGSDAIKEYLTLSVKTAITKGVIS